jgi:HK97 family phage prohead protease
MRRLKETTVREKEQVTAPTDVSPESDEGSFRAIAATWDVDREGDRLEPGAFRESLREWQDAAKQVPILWGHGREAADVIGHADPAEIEENEQGLVIEGQLDIADSEAAAEAWRSVRQGRLSLSFGFVILASHEEQGGVRVIDEIDLVELTLTSVPANAATRVLSAKHLKAFPQRNTYDDAEWRQACVIDLADCGQMWAEAPAKQRFLLPIATPEGEVTPEALSAAAGVLADPEATLQGVCDTALEKARARLAAAFDEAGVAPPESLTASGKSIAVKSVRLYSFPAS